MIKISEKTHKRLSRKAGWAIDFLKKIDECPLSKNAIKHLKRPSPKEPYTRELFDPFEKAL